MSTKLSIHSGHPSFLPIALKLCIVSILTVISIALPDALYSSRPVQSHAMPYIHSLDPTLQAVANDQLRAVLDRADAKRGGVLVIDARTGAIKALIDVDSSNYQHVTGSLMTRSAWEPGSVVKPLTIAAALNEGVVNLNTRFYDTGETYVQGYQVTNAIVNQPRTITIQDIINQSINTGTVNVLRRLGDSEEINAKARQTLYRYFTERYRFGSNNIPGLTAGFIPPPYVGNNLELKYANMAFGQSMTVTPLQLASAYAAVLNGGTFVQPQLEHEGIRVMSRHIVSEQTSKQIRLLLQKALSTNNQAAQRSGYTMGGKTGTAHVATQTGEYHNSHRDNGAYIGFIADANNTYIMLVRIDEPKTQDYSFASNLAKQTWTAIVTAKIDTTGSFTN